jgi:oligopeptide/dipeptide ABC transporter ATP-binding protein
MSPASDPILEVSGLRVALAGDESVVEGVDLQLGSGEILGLVGESGAGKTTTVLSLFGYTWAGARIAGVDVKIAGEPMSTEAQLRRARGRLLSYVPQNPGTALNPSMRIGQAVQDLLNAHRAEKASAGSPRDWLGRMHLPATPEFLRRYPHQLSGGQQQRVCIAGALACEPAVIVLDEPTTGLDVVTQATILTELTRLRDEQGVSMIYVTHDLAVVAQLADRIAVMYAGRIVEQGPANVVLRRPRHPYTRGLLASIPDHVRPRALEAMPGIAVGVGERPPGCPFAPRCPQSVDRCVAAHPALEPVGPGHLARCFEWQRTPGLEVDRPLVERRAIAEPEVPVLRVENLRAVHRTSGETVVAAEDVSFDVPRGRCVALVGESGSGKTTIARVIAGLHPIESGRLMLDGHPLPGPARARTVDIRRRVQIVFQNPADALNPRKTIEQSIARPARILRNLDRRQAVAEVDRLLEAVRLHSRLKGCYPGELSGGERQRVAIARALAAAPEVLVCDEITSALDVSVQAAVLELLDRLRAEMGLSLIFITHDLGVVATIADHVLVLEQGVVCEQGPPQDILNAPQHPYTQRLLESAPSLQIALEAWRATGSSPPASPAAQATERRGDEAGGLQNDGGVSIAPT